MDLIDLRKLKGWDDFKGERKDRSCDIVGIHTNTVNFEYAIRCAEIAHQMGKTVIARGSHATMDPQELLDTDNVDYIITGEQRLPSLMYSRNLRKVSMSEK